MTRAPRFVIQNMDFSSYRKDGHLKRNDGSGSYEKDGRLCKTFIDYLLFEGETTNLNLGDFLVIFIKILNIKNDLT